MASVELAIVIKDFNPEKGGGEKYAVRLAESLKKQGYNFDVLCRSVHSDYKTEQVKFVSEGKGKFFPSYQFNKDCLLYLSKETYPCVLGLTQVEGCHIYRAGGGLIPFWEEIKYKGMIGQLRRSLSFNHQLVKSLEKRVLLNEKLQHLIVNSPLVQNQVESFYPQLKEKLVMIPNGVDKSCVGKEPSQVGDVQYSLKGGKGTYKLLFVSNNFERKGLYQIFEAMAQLESSKRPHLYVLGRGNKKKAEEVLKNQSLRDFVTFLGSLSSIGSIYSQVDAYILPTYYDPCSNSTLEAMVWGLPIITSSFNGASHWVDEKNGFVLSSLDDLRGMVGSLAALNDLSLRKAMGLVSEERGKLFSWEENAKEVALLIQDVLKRK